MLYFIRSKMISYFHTMKLLTLIITCVLIFIFALVLSGIFKSYLNFEPGFGSRQHGPGDLLVPFHELMKGPLRQDDRRIIDYILSKDYILRPTPDSEPYELSQPYNKDPSMGQASIVQKIFNNKREGFFVECGALDGETRSNTLWLERNFGWRGLLIEGDPSNYQLVLSKKRKAWTAGCCLSIHPYPHEVWYQQDFNTGSILVDNVHEMQSNKSLVQMQCFPIFSLLTALHVNTVDYLSLDVEGYELDVLRTIPFDDINIKVLSVEFTHGPGGADALVSFMKQRKYRVVTKLTHERSLANDLIFIREGIRLNATFPPVIKSKKI